MQPITVRPDNGHYIIVAGERRYRAVTSLGRQEIECIVYDGNSARELQLVENINRADLNPIEVARAYRAYLDDGHTMEELSEVTGKIRAWITMSLSLLDVRPDVQHLIERSQFSPAVGISMSKLTGNGQMDALRIMQSNKLNVSESRKVCDQIYAKENQPEMFPEVQPLSAKEVQVRERISSAFERACRAFEEINKVEDDNPGITAQAVIDKLDITQEKVTMLYNLVGQFKRSLEYRRVKALC